jgi:hypothetical protein
MRPAGLSRHENIGRELIFRRPEEVGGRAFESALQRIVATTDGSSKPFSSIPSGDPRTA